jgi:hypothetical protein
MTKRKWLDEFAGDEVFDAERRVRSPEAPVS